MVTGEKNKEVQIFAVLNLPFFGFAFLGVDASSLRGDFEPGHTDEDPPFFAVLDLPFFGFPFLGVDASSRID